jgi:hypothetical protein
MLGFIKEFFVIYEMYDIRYSKFNNINEIYCDGNRPMKTPSKIFLDVNAFHGQHILRQPLEKDKKIIFNTSQ